MLNNLLLYFLEKVRLLRSFIMPRKKTKSTAASTESKLVRSYFIECRQLTNDSVARAIADMSHQEIISPQEARRMTTILEAVISDSFSRVMANKNL